MGRRPLDGRRRRFFWMWCWLYDLSSSLSRKGGMRRRLFGLLPAFLPVGIPNFTLPSKMRSFSLPTLTMPTSSCDSRCPMSWRFALNRMILPGVVPTRLLAHMLPCVLWPSLKFLFGVIYLFQLSDLCLKKREG